MEGIEGHEITLNYVNSGWMWAYVVRSLKIYACELMKLLFEEGGLRESYSYMQVRVLGRQRRQFEVL